MFFWYSLTGCGFDQPFLNCQYSKIKAMPIDLGWIDRSTIDFKGNHSLDDFAVKTLHTSNSVLLGQWLNSKLFGISYLVGKIKFKLLFQGPLAK